MKNWKRIALIATIGWFAAVLVVNTAGASPTYAHPRVHNWYAHHGGKKAIKNLVAVETSISTDAGNENFDATQADCQKLQDVTQVDNAIAPIPNKVYERLWGTALNDYDQAGIMCVRGIEDSSTSELQQAISETDAGNALVKEFASELNS